MCPSASQAPSLFDLMPPYTLFWTMIPVLLFLLSIPVAGVRKAIRLFRRWSVEHPPRILRWLQGLYDLCFLANFVLVLFLVAWAMLLLQWSELSPAYHACAESPLLFGLKAHPGDAVWVVVAVLIGFGLRGIRKLYQQKARRWASGTNNQENT